VVTSQNDVDDTPALHRWGRHRVLAAAITVGMVIVPVACSVGSAVLYGHLTTQPDNALGFAGWWLAMLLVSTIAFVLAERAMRRALPLTIMLEMNLLFPGEAPKRLSVARRAGSTRELTRRLDEARTRGTADMSTRAAEEIVTLAVSLSTHDRVTRGHAERVRALTDLIADELQLSTDRKERLRWSALLHDIGKLTVHPHVLNKPGALSDEEWALVRRHPLEGARITQPLSSWLGEWAQTIAEHHERFDGKGYPYGVSGRQISLGGRIVAVADTYDVMTSTRSYKRPMAPEVARKELAACAGSQFDPEIVRAFLGVSLRRIRRAVPLAWLSSVPLANFAARLGSLGSFGAVGGNAVAAGVFAGAGVLGLGVTNATTTPGSQPPAQAAPQGGSGSGAASPSGSGAAGNGSAGGNTATGSARTDAGRSGADGNDAGGTATSTTDGSAGGDSGSGGAASGSGSGSGSGSDPGTGSGSGSGPTGGGTTTTASGSGTTTSVGGPTTSAPATTTTAAPTTTVPPPASPTNLTATGSCAVIVLVPEATLTWTASPTTSVTGYQILRSTNGTSYSVVTTVSGRTTTTYADTAVSGGTKYWYEVRASAPSGTATSNAASTTTPALCL
jgi:putative nucleotidyltransferase with HDIG domain